LLVGNQVGTKWEADFSDTSSFIGFYGEQGSDRIHQLGFVVQDIPCSEYVPDSGSGSGRKSVEDDEASKFGVIVIIGAVVIVIIIAFIVTICICKKKKDDSLHERKIQVITSHVAQADSIVVEDMLDDAEQPVSSSIPQVRPNMPGSASILDSKTDGFKEIEMASASLDITNYNASIDIERSRGTGGLRKSAVNVFSSAETRNLES